MVKRRSVFVFVLFLVYSIGVVHGFVYDDGVKGWLASRCEFYRLVNDIKP